MNKKIQSKANGNDWGKKSNLSPKEQNSFNKALGLKEKLLFGGALAALITLAVVGFSITSSNKEDEASAQTINKKPTRILNLSDKGSGEISFGSIKDGKILEDDGAKNYYSTTAKESPETKVPPMVPMKDTATQSTTTSPRIMKMPKDMDAVEFNNLLSKGNLPLERFDFLITREEGLPEHLKQKYKDHPYPIEINGKELFANLRKK